MADAENTTYAASAAAAAATAAAEHPLLPWFPSLWDQPDLGWKVFLLVPVAAAAVVLNIITFLEIVREDGGQCTKYYAYLASLAICDALNATFALPLSIAKSYSDHVTGSQSLSDAWYCLDVTFRTVGLLHLTAASLDFYLELNGTVWYLSRQQRKQTLLKLGVCCWTIAIVLALPPFLWYHAAARYTASRLRKLILCAFVLSFLLPLVAQILSYALLFRSWMSTRKAVSRYDTEYRNHAEKQLDRDGRRFLTRTESGLSRRGSHRHQGSYRSKRSGSSKAAVAAQHQTNRSSPQLDRHPSLRYSIKRKRSGASSIVLIDHPTTSTSARPQELDTCHVLDPAAIEQRLVEVAAEGDSMAAATFLPVQDQHLTESRGGGGGGSESKRSSRSSNASRGPDSPKLDRHPSLRFSTRRRPPQPGEPNSSRKNSSRNSLEPAADPYLLLTSLQVSHKKLSAQVSFPESYTWHQERSRYLPTTAAKPHHSSGEEIEASMREDGTKKRGSYNRRSTGGGISRKEMKGSPKLDRHPSMRFSTKRKPGPTEKVKKKKKKTASNLSIAGQGFQGSYVGLHMGDISPQRNTSGSLSIGRNAAAAAAAAVEQQVLQQPRSRGGSNISIGTCHDLQGSLSSYSIKNKQDQQQQQQGPSKTGEIAFFTDDNYNRQTTRLSDCSRQNLLQVGAVSNRDIARGGSDDRPKMLDASTPQTPTAEESSAAGTTVETRRRSAEGPSSNRSSYKRRFQKDTNHAVEDWLSLDAAATKRTHPSLPNQQHLMRPSNSLRSASDIDFDSAAAAQLQPSTADSLLRHHGVDAQENLSPQAFFHRYTQDFRLLSANVVAMVLLNLPWMVATLAVGFCQKCQFVHTSTASWPSLLLFFFQCLSSLITIVRPTLCHVCHAGFRTAFRRLLHLKKCCT